MDFWPAFFQILPYILSFTVSLVVAALTWRYRRIRGAGAFSLLAWVQSLWTAAYIFQLLADQLNPKLFWNSAQMVAAILAPLFYMFFALQFADRQPQKYRLFWSFLSLPALASLFLVLSDPWLHLFRAQSWVANGVLFNRLVFLEAPGFWFFTLYTYAYLLATTLVLLTNLIGASRIYRLQIGAVMLGVSFTWLASIPAMLHLIPIQLHDLTPLMFVVTNAFVVVGLFRFRLFSIVPVARNFVLQQISDGVIVLDERLQIVDLNPAAAQFFGQREEALLMKALPARLDFIRAALSRPGGNPAQQTHIHQDSDNRFYDFTIRPLQTLTERYSGWLILIHEITDLKRAEFMERKSRAQAETQWRIAHTLSQSLDMAALQDQLAGLASQVAPCDAVYHFEMHKGLLTIHKKLNGADGPYSRFAPFAFQQDLLLKQNLLKEHPVRLNLNEHREFCSHFEIEPHMGDALVLPVFYHAEVFAVLLLLKDEKDFFQEEHLTALRTFAAQAALALQNARLFWQTQELASHDPLTNLYNRRFFFDHVKDQLTDQMPLSIIMIDIDHFKQVNDRYGHLVGDQVLQEVARTIHANIRQDDLVCRYGGEEFVLFLPRMTIQQSENRAESIRQAIENLEIEIEGHPIRITVSMGISQLQPGEQTTLDQLLEQADQALYMAKENQRNCVCLYTRK